MKTIKYNIALFSYWAIGSGTGQGKGLDNILLKDDDNLPFIPGKTLKGLLRDAAVECDATKIDRWIGGVHLTPSNLWCWNSKLRSLVKPVLY